jgi:hypothetical protein
MEKLSRFVIKWKWLFIIVFLIAAVCMGIQLKNIHFNPDMLTYLPDDMPARANQKKIEELFGGTDMVMVVLKTDDIVNAETLKRVREISHEMKKIKGIEKVMSLFDTKQVRNEDDAMIVDPAVKKIPKSSKEIQEIKEELSANDLVYGSVVSKDFTTTAVIGMLEPGIPDKSVVEPLEKLIQKIPGNEETFLGGSPYLRVQTSTSMQHDITHLLPFGILLMLLFLFVSFRQIRGVWTSSLVVFMSIFVVFGSIPLFHWDFTVVTIILPVLLLAVANDYGIHMFTHYQDDNNPGNTLTKQEISSRMMTSLGKPIIIAGLTTIAGLFCMLGHILIPAWQMGILGGIGIGFALLASLLFIPAVSATLPKIKPLPDRKRNAVGMVKLLDTISTVVTEHPRRIVSCFIVITAIVFLGITKLSVNTNPTDLYPDGHPAKESSKIINDELGGFFPLSIVFEGDIKDPVLLQRIDKIEKTIKEMPEVGTTQSIATVTRQISRALNTPDDPDYDKIPDSYNAVSQYFELYLMSGDPDDLEKMVDFSFRKAMILIRFKELNTPIIRKVVREIKELVKDDPNVALIGGNADVFSSMDKEIVHGQFRSLGLSLLIVCIIIALAFRSLKAAFLQIVPLVFAMMFLFGIMGFTGIELNYTTALLSSIMIGVGIDYTIHLFWKYREEIRNGMEREKAVTCAITTTGRGIIYNAFSVIIGFASLLVSSFLTVRFFGLLMILIIFACLAGGLILVPAICMFLRPDFLKRRSKRETISGGVSWDM